MQFSTGLVPVVVEKSGLLQYVLNSTYVVLHILVNGWYSIYETEQIIPHQQPAIICTGCYVVLYIF